MEIKKCPFCGGNFAEYNLCEDEDTLVEQYNIVCNAQKGGCGASCGYAFTKKEAEKKWNRRVDDGRED